MDEMFFDNTEDEAILPEGGDTLFVDEDTRSAEQTEVLDEAEADSEVVDGEVSADEGPTTANESGEKENGEAEDDTDTPDGEKPVERQPRRIKGKFNHKEKLYTLDEMSDEEIAIRFQKSEAFDQMTKRESDRIRQEVYDAQIEAGMTEDVASMIADMKASNYHYQDDSADTSEDEATDTKLDFDTELKNFQKKYPDVTEIPTQVMDDYLNNGIPLSDGYSKYENKRVQKHAAAVEKENKILRQNAANAAKAPVTGVRGGGKITEKRDDFLAGLDSEDW